MVGNVKKFFINILIFYLSLKGTKRLCQDAEYMLNIKTSIYYRICWSIITPLAMIIILVYTLLTMKPLTYNGLEFPLPYRSKKISNSQFKNLLKRLFPYFQFSAGP